MMTWTKESDGSFISANECYLLHKRKDRYFDVIPADGPKLNTKRLPLAEAKILAEQHAAGPELPSDEPPVIKDCTGQPLPAETLARLHDQGDMGSIPGGRITAGMRAILAPVAEQRTKKPKVTATTTINAGSESSPFLVDVVETKKPKAVTVTVERPDGEKADLGIECDDCGNRRAPTCSANGGGKHAPVDPRGPARTKVTKAKKPRKLKGGIGGEPKVESAPTPPALALTSAQVQAIVDELVWRHGSNVSEWLDYPKLLVDAKLHPEQVTDLVLEKAREAARERQGRERPQAGPKEYRIGQLFVGCCVDASGRKAEIIAANDGEVKVRAYEADGKSSTQHWSPSTMVTVIDKDELKPVKVEKAKAEPPASSETEEAPAKPAKTVIKAPKPAAKETAEPSNKETVYRAWHGSKDKGADKADAYFKLVKEAVKLSTIRGWILAWAKGKNLPACATK